MKPLGNNIRTVLVAALLPVSLLVSQARTVSVDTLTYDKAAASSPLDLLHGRVSGVRVFSTDGNPAGMKGVHIRGLRSLRSDSQPLYVVDGAVLGTATNINTNAFWQYDEQVYTSALNPFAFLSPYDIESIEVLKDMSATAKYGTRGANGVIIIKTRKAGNGDFRADWNSNFTAYPTFAHNHSLNISGSHNQSGYSISAFYRNKTGSIARNRADDAGVRLHFETNANSLINFGFNSMLSMAGSSNPTGTAWLGKSSATLAAMDETLAMGTSEADWKAGYDDDAVDYRTVNSVWLNINFLPVLHWKTTFGLDYQNINRVVWCGNETPFGKAHNGAAAALNSMLLNYNADTRLEFSMFLGGRHHLDAYAGVEVTGNWNSFNTMNGTNFMTHELRGKGLSLMQSDKQIHKFVRSYVTGAAFVSAGYDYDGMAGVNAQARMEVTPKYRDWTPVVYPSVEGYVDFHKALLKDYQTVSTLKLRGGWGTSGKELFVPYELTSDHLMGQWYKAGDDAGVYYDGLNRVLSSGWNIGLSVGLLSDRVMLSAAYYDDKSYDIYDMFCFGVFDGKLWRWGERRQVFERVASFVNRGIDFDVNARIIDTAGWLWSAYADFSWNINQAVSLTRHDVWGRNLGNGLVGTLNTPGSPLGSFGGYRENNDGSLKDVTRDGKVTSADRVLLGNSLPKYYGGFGTSLSFMGITLDVRMDGAAGFNVVNLSRMLKDGNTQLSESYVEKGDYLRLSRVSLGYDIPLNLRWIRSLEVHASAHNLLTFTSYSGNTPDVSSYGVSALSFGYDYGSFPVMKTVVLGISAKF